jgi:thioredoxin 1
MEAIEEFGAENWAGQVLGADDPVLVDFRAPWCDPELFQTQTLEQLRGEWLDLVRIGTVDVARFTKVIFQYRIQEFPTLALFQAGHLVKAFGGSRRVERMKAWLMDRQDPDQNQAS